MPKVAVYTRATTGGSRRRYVKATRGSTGPFFLRYDVSGRSFTFNNLPIIIRYIAPIFL